MKYATPINITYKKQINEIGSVLVDTRRNIAQLNPQLKQSETVLLKLVLLGCMYVQIIAHEKRTVNATATNFNVIATYVDTELGSPFSQKYLDSYINLENVRCEGIIEKLLKIKTIANWLELLPYALELLDYSEDDLSGASLDRRNGIVTKKKKNSGIYYTPTDVAQYMALRCINKLYESGEFEKGNIRFMDFSCGSGIFLIQILSICICKKIVSDSRQCAHFIARSIFGMDISEFAVECSKFCVISYCLSSESIEKSNVPYIYNSLNKNIVCSDGTAFEEFTETHPDYPKTFSCIIGNPPYVSKTQAAENLFIPFVYNAIRYSDTFSMSALVLPLSLAYNNKADFCSLRTAIKEDSSLWQFEHYDRSPDSLFGDDVKSRACIIFRDSYENSALFTTKLIRWTSIFREQTLFGVKEKVDISDLPIFKFIPKISTPIEKDAFLKITSGKVSLLGTLGVSKKEITPFPIVIKGTAYNWICAYDHIPYACDKNGVPFISKEMKFFYVETMEDQYFAIAVLNSIMTFWLWTVIGDGFHVTNSLFSMVKIEKNMFSESDYAKIIALGKEISARMVNYKSSTTNRGKIITNYNHLPLLNLITEVDKILCKTIKAPESLSDYLSKWYSDFTKCGRNS